MRTGQNEGNEERCERRRGDYNQEALSQDGSGRGKNHHDREISLLDGKRGG